MTIDQISDWDLKIARSPRAIALLDEIIPLSLEARTRELKALQQKIQQGEANLFEENVHVKLLENRKAEWIRVIHRNLPSIEKELKKRKESQPPSVNRSPDPSDHPATPPAPVDEYPSELLEFLATQKPPATPVKSSAARIRIAAEERSSSRFRDIVIGVSLCMLLLGSVWYVYSSENTLQSLSTFNSQAQESSAETKVSDQLQQQIQTQFDAAIQELRLGEFDHGKAQLLDLIQTYPDNSQAEYAYIAIADAYRQRQNSPDEALRYYQLFIENYPASQHIGLTQLKMGFSYEDMEDSANAEQIYRLVLKNNGEKSRVGQLAHERLSRLQNK